MIENTNDEQIERLNSRIVELLRERDALVKALEDIKALGPKPFAFPTDWQEQIDACSECQRYKHHPIQQGICNTHRKPLYERKRHDRFEEKAIGYRAQSIAREAIASIKEPMNDTEET